MLLKTWKKFGKSEKKNFNDRQLFKLYKSLKIQPLIFVEKVFTCSNYYKSLFYLFEDNNSLKIVSWRHLLVCFNFLSLSNLRFMKKIKKISQVVLKHVECVVIAMCKKTSNFHTIYKGIYLRKILKAQLW